MFGVKVCFYIFHIFLSLTNAWLYVKHVWENTFSFSESLLLCLMAIRNATLADN